MNRPMNETDVREMVASPFLSHLGYASGTPNDINREKTLRYAREFLGRKKSTDPELRGRADYVLSVLGAGAWTLEIKSETVEIDQDAVEQAISYARHPEVSGAYAAILNGKRFVLYHCNQTSNDAPRVDISVSSPVELAKSLQSVLSPSAIRRDCAPPKVDLQLPLADGFRSTATILSGSITYDKFSWKSNVDIPPIAKAQFDETCRRMSGLKVSALGGKIWRDDSSRLRVHLEWAAPNDEMLKFARDKQMLNLQYVSLAPTISSDPAKPSIFQVVAELEINVGEQLFDMATWKTNVADIDVVMLMRGQATGFLDGEVFRGTADAGYLTTYPVMPGLQINMFGTGVFAFKVKP